MARLRYVRPYLYPKQHQAVFDPSRFVVVDASTKSGKTVGCMAWLLELAMRTSVREAEFWWVAPVYGQAKIAFRRYLRKLPEWLYTANHSDLTITLAHNRAVLRFRSGEKPDALYGEDVYGAVVDEASRCREQAWHALRSTLTATRGPARLIGNVKGRGNWAYKLGQRAKAGDLPGFAYHMITAYDAIAGGVLDPEEIAAAKRELPDAVFRELYLCEPTDDGSNPFGFAFIRAATMSEPSPLAAVVFGWDLGKHVDWTVGCGLDEFGRVSAFERWQRASWPVSIARIKATTNGLPALVDSTGLGDVVQDHLAPSGNFEGFVFSAKTKQQLVEHLILGVQNGEAMFPEGKIAEEMREFEYVATRTGVRYEAPEGYHDDCVMSLALAYWHQKHGMKSKIWYQ